jgi:hypothetical protein
VAYSAEASMMKNKSFIASTPDLSDAILFQKIQIQKFEL